jgi:phosphomannomutase
MAKLRANPPAKVADDAVVSVRDYLDPASPLPKSDVLAFQLASGSRIIARPSGTEPKAKFYFDVREAMTAGETLAEAEARASATMKKLADAFTAIATG